MEEEGDHIEVAVTTEEEDQVVQDLIVIAIDIEEGEEVAIHGHRIN